MHLTLFAIFRWIKNGLLLNDSGMSNLAKNSNFFVLILWNNMTIRNSLTKRKRLIDVKFSNNRIATILLGSIWVSLGRANIVVLIFLIKIHFVNKPSYFNFFHCSRFFILTYWGIFIFFLLSGFVIILLKMMIALAWWLLF